MEITKIMQTTPEQQKTRNHRAKLRKRGEGEKNKVKKNNQDLSG